MSICIHFKYFVLDIGKFIFTCTAWAELCSCSLEMHSAFEGFNAEVNAARKDNHKYLVLALGTCLTLSSEFYLEASCPRCMGSLH